MILTSVITGNTPKPFLEIAPEDFEADHGRCAQDDDGAADQNQWSHHLTIEEISKNGRELRMNDE